MKKMIFAIPALTTFVGIMSIVSDNIAWFLLMCLCYFVSCGLSALWFEKHPSLVNHKVFVAIIIAIFASPIVILMFRNPLSNYALMTNISLIGAMVVSWVSAFLTYGVITDEA